ncbi:MAG: hypothetical protein WC838_07060 [Candidatus Margulisiibacteriota bacterium]|jgi:hypothetical protein
MNSFKRENIHLPTVRIWLKNLIAISWFHQIRGQTLPYAEAQRLLTDEDIFKVLQ